MSRETLINDLNDDLANEYGAIIQYLTYAAKVSGPYRLELSKFFLGEVPDETGHAEFLAKKIVALGGEPGTRAAVVRGASSSRQMLDAVVEAERGAVTRYTARARQADQFGDKGLQVQLEDMVRDETEHLEEALRILSDWSE